jgi:predicted component of type VI protein secretion system
MANDETIERLNALEKKVRLLINANKKMMALTAEIKEKNAALVEQNNVYKRQLEDFQLKAKTSTLAQRIADNPIDEKRKLKLQINEYIREIDRCLSILNA